MLGPFKETPGSHRFSAFWLRSSEETKCLCFSLYLNSMNRNHFYYFQIHTGVVGEKDKSFNDEE